MWKLKSRTPFPASAGVPVGTYSEEVLPGFLLWLLDKRGGILLQALENYGHTSHVEGQEQNQEGRETSGGLAMGCIFSGKNQNTAQPTGISEMAQCHPLIMKKESRAQRKTDLVSSHNSWGVLSGAHLSQDRVRGKRIWLQIWKRNAISSSWKLYIFQTLC